MNAILPTARKHKPLAAFLTLAAALLALAPGAKAALTPNYYFNANGSAGGTWKDGSGKWANCASTAYYFWQTSTTGTASTGQVFGTAQSTTTIQFGGTTKGTAGTISVHSAKNPTVGAIIFAKPNSGEYTISQGTGAGANVNTTITLAGVSGSESPGSGTYGIVMNSDSPSVTFTNATEASQNGQAIKINLTQNQKWVNNNTTSTNSLNVYGNIGGAFTLTTYGNILLGGSNAFGSLAVGSGTTTIDNSASVGGNTISAGNSLYLGTAGNGTVKLGQNATLKISASTNATTFATSTNGNLVIGTGGVLTITNSGSGAANNTANGGIGTANLSVAGGSFVNTGSGTLTVGTLTLGGNGKLTYGYDSPITSTNASGVSASGTGNLLTITGSPGIGTYTLINGVSFSGLTSDSLSVTGTALGNTTVPYGTTGNVGRSTYQITNTATSLQLVIGGGAFNLNWTGASNNNWTTSVADVNWATVVGATNASFYNNDNVNFTNAATITVDAGGVSPGGVSFKNATNTTVALSGGSITASSVSMSGSGTATVANTLSSASAVTAGSGGKLLFSGPLTVSAGGLSATNGATVQLNAAATVTGGVTANGGTVTLGSGGSISGSAITVNNGGTFNANAANTAPAITVSGGTIGGSGTLTATSITAASGVNTIAAALAGSGNVNVGSGTTTISGANSGFTGGIATTNALGQLGSIVQMGSADAAAGSGNITILTNNALDLNGQNLTRGMNLLLGSSGNTNRAGVSDSTPYGGLINNSTNNATYAGDVYVNGGNPPNFLNMPGSVAVGYTTNASGTVAGNTTNGGGITLSGNVTIGSRGLTKVGLGTLTLSGTGNGGSGGVLKITDGTVYFPAPANLSSAWTINSGGSVASTGAMLLGGSTNSYSVGGFSIGGIMSINESGAGTATINLGAGVITGTSTKQINVGSNVVANFSSFELGLTQSANRAGNFGVDGTVNFIGAVTGALDTNTAVFTAGFTKSGSGTVAFNGTNTYTGPTTVSNGVVAFKVLPALNSDGTTTNIGSAFGVNPQITLGSSTNTATLAFKGGVQVVDDGVILTTNIVGGLLTNQVTLSSVGGTNVLSHEGTGTLTVNATITPNGANNTLVLAGSNANKVSDATAGPGVMNSVIANGQTNSTVNIISPVTSAYASGATVITVANAANFLVGTAVSGTGIPASTTVSSISGNNVTLSAATTAAGSVGNNITFGAYAANVSGLTQIAVTNGSVLAGVGSKVSGTGIADGTTITAVSTNGIYTLSTPTVNASSFTTSSAITFDGITSLTKTGSGTWSLGATNTYSGATTVNAGSLAITVNNAIGTNSAVTVSGGTLNMGSYTNTVASLTMGSGTLAMAASKTSAVQLASTGTAALGSSATLDLTGMSTSAAVYKLLSGSSLTGTFSSVTGLSSLYALQYGTLTANELDAQHKATIGTITATPAASSIITGGSTAFTFTVGNSAPTDSASLAFSAASSTGTTGSVTGPVSVAAQGTSSSQSGLSYNGTAIGTNNGLFTVNDPSATATSGTGTVTVNVYDHASGSLTNSTISLGNLHSDYSSASASVNAANASGYRVNLAGSTVDSNGISFNALSGVTPGSSSAVTATLASGKTAGAISQGFTYTFADDSSLSGHSANVGSSSITVTGGVYNYAAAGLSTASIDLGNIHAGGSFATSYLSLTNTASGPDGYVETLGAVFTNASGVSTSGSVSGLVAGGINNAMGVSLSDNTVGAKSGTVGVAFTSQSVASGLSNSSLGSSSITVSGGVYNYAVGGFATTTVNLGNIHQDDTFATNYLSVTNTASGPAGYVETLGAAFTNASGVTTVGSLSGLGAGNSTNTLGVTLANSGSGSVGGTANLAYTSEAIASGLSNSTAGTSAQITVTGGVYNYAAAGIQTNVDLGNIHAGGTFATNAVALTNTATGTTGYVENLAAALTNATGVSASGSVSGLQSGVSSSAIQVTIANNTAGAKSGTVGVALTSESIASGLNNSSLGTKTVNVSGFVYTGQGVWNHGSGSWGTFDNWQQAGGTPGLDGALSANDTATFGSGGSGTVRLDGSSPSISALSFSNASSSYSISTGTGSATLTLTAGSSAASISNAAGTHSINAPLTLGSDVTLQNESGTKLTLGGVVCGTGGLTQAGSGTVALNAANTFTGATKINAGTLALGADGSLASTSIGLAGGTLDLTSKTAYTFSGGQSLSGSGSVNIGSGTVTVSGNLTPTALTFNGNINLAGLTTMNINGPTDYSSITATGSRISYGGNIVLNLGSSYDPSAGATFNLFRGGSSFNDSASIALSGTYSGSLVQVSSTGVYTGQYGGNTYVFSQADGTLQVTAVPEPSTCMMMGIGLTALVMIIVRRRRSMES